MDNSMESALIIQEHDFQEAKNSLKLYSEVANKEIKLNAVRTRGRFLQLGNHKVTGEELNEITSQIQNYFMENNKFNQGIVDEFDQVYKAFESLDKDYISGIVNSIETAKKVSLDEQKDREDIKKLVNNLDIVVKALKKFKEDLEKLKHLTDIDTIWELTKRQSEKISQLSEAQLLALKEIATEQANRLLEISNEQDKKLAELTQTQKEWMTSVNKSLEEERNHLQSQVTTLTKKVKITCAIAGGTTGIAVLHMVLNILGVI